MSNMGYCRFENTLLDLKDCYENMEDKLLSAREETCRDALVNLCCEIALDYGYSYVGRSLDEA